MNVVSTAEQMPNETYDWAAAQARLREQVDQEFAPAWQPEPGEELLATVVSVTAAAHTVYGPSPVVEVATPTGDRLSVWLFSTVLRRAFERQRVAIGELILIRYKGKVTPERGGNPYRDYALVVDRPAGVAPDWRDIAARYDDDVDEDHSGPRHEARDRVAEHIADVDDDIPF